MLSLYRIPTNTHERKQKFSNANLDDNSNCEHEPKGLQMTSNHLKRPPTMSKESSLIKSKNNKLKVGGNIEINDENLDEILHNKNH